MSVTGFPMGLASEASYDMLPGLGCSRHEEILVFIDDLRGLEVVERHSCAAPFVMSHRVSTVAELPVGILDEMPEQAMIVRPSAGDCRGRIEKGITEIASLQHAIARAAAASTDGKALLEPDLRAFHNPNRREVLTQLSYRLARRLNTRCPACGARALAGSASFPDSAAATASPQLDRRWPSERLQHLPPPLRRECCSVGRSGSLPVLQSVKRSWLARPEIDRSLLARRRSDTGTIAET
jgi:hypothetical protein